VYQAGRGLGLALSQKFVRLLGGKIHVRSNIGYGTTFTFELPVKVIEADTIDTKASVRHVVALEPNQPCYRMLIADDNRDNRQILIKLLKPFICSTSSDQGFKLREAENGQEVLNLWETWKPHIIWMDMRMPVIDGYDATKRIRALGTGHWALKTRDGEHESRDVQNLESAPQTPVIIAMTASSFEKEQAIALSVGCDDFLRKPFHEHEIFDLLHQHLGVRFVYGEERQGAGSREQGAGEEVRTSEALAALPEDLLADLRYAVEEIDPEKTLKIIAQIGQQNRLLAEALAELVKKFRFDTLQDLFENIPK
jgi:CheY-like chemotaxis protein